MGGSLLSWSPTISNFSISARTGLIRLSSAASENSAGIWIETGTGSRSPDLPDPKNQTNTSSQRPLRHRGGRPMGDPPNSLCDGPSDNLYEQNRSGCPVAPTAGPRRFFSRIGIFIEQLREAVHHGTAKLFRVHDGYCAAIIPRDVMADTDGDNFDR